MTKSEMIRGSIGLCGDCGKMCFLSRSAAKRYAKGQFPSHNFSFYKCGEYFHFGHKPYVVRRGVVDRRDLTRRTG